ncbi:HAD family hydrolase [Brachybacterium sp. p3-SID1565]|uniref:HAD family hydrolase n=1 Tax=Brachybacterium sp. p3-SID1565 TaxID=2916046 RepID=UPI0021A83E02|nr:HAD family hydrolase [Brachybacterium sp. p3-SID1565]MCT1386123.1 HAD family hydrolase [Brachybacterium sp. p3-SID1565]
MSTALSTTTPAADEHRPAVLPRPRALLLDFGGVVFSTTPRVSWARDLAAELEDRSRALGIRLDAEQLEESLRAGRTALSLWKNAASRRHEPRELTPREIVADFLLADLPAAARAALALDASAILASMSVLVSDHHVRPGIPELLSVARENDVRLGIVSNAHSGRAHREILEQHGLARYFGVQVYSDEVGIRKPHPGMIHRAAEALGTLSEHAWYVGDTFDRDVAAGRRAGVGTVVITRDRRTDHPPFAVTDIPDLILETPQDLVAHLHTALAEGDRGSEPAAAARLGVTDRGLRPTAAGPAHPALLLDHGGVITLSTPNPQRNRQVGELIVDLAERIGTPVTIEQAQQAVDEGWERHRARKRERDAQADAGHRHAEVDPAELWGDLVGRDLPETLRAALRIEGPQLSLALHRAKSLPAPRPGAVELIRWCAEHEVVVGIVSNTISGRGVREILERYGVGHLIGPAAYSDEIGVRKPGTAVFEAALAGLETDPGDVVYVGDKVLNDGRGGREAGIGTVCLLRGGKDPDEALDSALAAGHADHVLDSPLDVIDLLASRLTPAS